MAVNILGMCFRGNCILFFIWISHGLCSKMNKYVSSIWNKRNNFKPKFPRKNLCFYDNYERHVKLMFQESSKILKLNFQFVPCGPWSSTWSLDEYIIKAIYYRVIKMANKCRALFRTQIEHHSTIYVSVPSLPVGLGVAKSKNKYSP